MPMRLATLPQTPSAAASEGSGPREPAIERRALTGQGIGCVDAHLLAAAVIEGTASIWTRDKRLAAVAQGLKIAFAA
jgi:predicted nucleic acid-binding protein